MASGQFAGGVQIVPAFNHWYPELCEGGAFGAGAV
jgi:hypothetical protein